MKKLVLTLICVLSVVSINFCAFAAEPKMILQLPVYDYLNGTVTISGSSDTAEFVAVQILKQGYTYDTISNTEADGSKILYRGQADVNDGEFTLCISFDCAETDDYWTRVVTEKADKQDFTLRLIPKGMYSSACDALATEVSENDFEGFCYIINTRAEDLGFTYTIDGVVLEEALVPYFEYLKDNPLDKEKYDDNVRTYSGFVLYNGLSNGLVDNVNSEIELLDFTTEKLVSDYREICSGDAGNATAQKQKYFTQKLSNQPIDRQSKFEKIWKQALVLTATRYADGPAMIYNAVSDYGSAFDDVLSAPTMAICRGLAGNDYTATAFAEAYKKLADTSDGRGNAGGGGGGGNTMPSGQYGQTITQPEMIEPLKVVFNDIEGVDWATEAILALADKGVICGVEPGIFKPNQNITREEFVKILLGAMGYNEGVVTTEVFADVSKDAWFCSWVNLAAEKGIVNGIGEGLFGTGQQITRQDMTKMICNALSYAGNTLPDSKFIFGDDEVIAEYAKTSVYALYELGAVKGKTETTFDPLSFATRAEAAKIIYNVWKLLEI